ncbi:MAG: EAL domain-containing protein [Holophagales bacterium]|nr:EAL domain-containing protein [Holophagales bacterium]
MTTPVPPVAENLRILVLEDVASDAELEIRELRQAGILGEWLRVETEAEFRATLDEFTPNVVIADYSLPSWNGMKALKVVRELRPDLPFIIVTGSIDEETAADCIKSGADDYVLKERLGRLPHAVRAAREVWAARLARRKAEEEVRLSHSALEAAADGIVITGLDGAIVWANPAFTRMTGYELEEAIGKNPRLLRSGVQREAFYRQMWETIKAGGVWRGELYNRRKDGTLYVEEMTITPVLGEQGEITHYVSIKQDVTARKRQEEVIQNLATRDLLTGLPNQSVLREEIEQIVGRGDGGPAASLVMLDIDRFSVLNGALGHPAGDRLLVELTERMTQILPSKGRLFRFGGDAFAALLDGEELTEAEAVAEGLRASIDGMRFASEGVVFDVTASLGVVPVEPSRSAAATLALADAALHIAKDEGRNRWVTCREDPVGRRAMDDLGRWAARVRDALRKDTLRLLAQRIVSLRTGETEHEEVLVRLVDDSGGLIAPGAFLPAAERFGLMTALDRWVVTRAIALLSATPGRRLFVNLSGTSLGDRALLTEFEALVAQSGLPPGVLTFEITETAAIADITGLQRWARRLKELGCGFALDDFGTGFSSFAYLQALPVDLVKIDGSFVRDLETNATNRALVGAMVAVAHALGKTVVAEMVERAPVADILRGLGVEYGQGWLWGRPEPAERS